MLLRIRLPMPLVEEGGIVSGEWGWGRRRGRERRTGI